MTHPTTEQRELLEHCQMSWQIKNMVKVFTCRQCGESVVYDHHPYRRCPAFTRAAAAIAKGEK